MNTIIQIAKSSLPASLQRVCRRYVHHRRKRSWRERTIEQNVFGHQMQVVLADPIAEKWYGRPVSVLPAVKYLCGENSMVQKDGLIFYIGAHHAVYAVGLSKLLEDRCRVIAVEGNPEHASVARRNIEANVMTNITVEAKAISDQNGELQFTLGHSVAKGDESIPTTKVSSITIDSLSEQYGSPDLVIIDVEGFEGRAIRGAGQTLDSKRSGAWKFIQTAV